MSNSKGHDAKAYFTRTGVRVKGSIFQRYVCNYCNWNSSSNNLCRLSQHLRNCKSIDDEIKEIFQINKIKRAPINNKNNLTLENSTNKNLRKDEISEDEEDLENEITDLVPKRQKTNAKESNILEYENLFTNCRSKTNHFY